MGEGDDARGRRRCCAAARDALAERRAVRRREAIEARSTAIVEDAGVKPKALYQPMRVAITGTTVSPGIFESLAALGRDEALARIDAALAGWPPLTGRAPEVHAYLPM